VLAGASRYRLPAFLVFTLVGRMLWTTAYLGVGYGVGANLEAAAGFLTNLSVLLDSLAVVVALGLVALMSSKSPQVNT
jgi:membrane protein DedA with SNARE-associated domain